MLMQAERLIFILPVWWADMPAIVKGFEDKVFLKNFAYYEIKAGVHGKLAHIREALVISTSTAPTFYLKCFCGNVINRAMLGHTIKGIGVGKRKWLNFGRVNYSTPEKRQKFLHGLARYV